MHLCIYASMHLSASKKIHKEKIAIILSQNLTKGVIFAVDYFAWRVDWTKTS